ncbi:MAG TPA: hypothetical protein VGB85_17750, partial [Nannocystis sp.]
MRHLGLVPALLLSLAPVGCGDDVAAGSDTDTGTSTDASTSTTDDTPTTGDSTIDPPTGTTGDGLCAADPDCDDDNDCTLDRCGGDGVCTVEAVVSNSCRPQITVDYPPRGATIVGKPGAPVVTVTGKVTSGAGAISTLMLNDEPVPVQKDGKFATDLLVTPGGTTLDFHVEDIAGGKRRRVQSFLWSSEYRRPEVSGEQMVPHGLAFYLGQQALDDGDPGTPADDIATLLGVALSSFDIAALIDPKKPITSTQGYDVYLTALSFGSTQVGLSARDGGLAITADLKDVLGDLFFDCTTWTCQLAGGDSTGGLSITKLGVTVDTTIYVDAQGQVQVMAMNAMANL